MWKIRLAGAQIPISTTSIEYNKKEIFKALDWAKENEVDELLTPECALSGYKPTWLNRIEELEEALKEVEDHQKKCGIGLHLGTMFNEPELHGNLNRNQVRHYNSGGELYARTDKCYLISSDMGADAYLVPSMYPCQPLKLPFDKSGSHRDYTGTCLICNDMWGNQQHQDHTPNEPISKKLEKLDTDSDLELILHATNGVKYPKEILEQFYGENSQQILDAMDSFHDGYLRQVAVKYHTSLLTVDACTWWNWDGDEEKVSQVMTSSQSGFINPLGTWQTNVPRFGRQYFYYDYNVDTALDFKPKKVGVDI